MKKVVWLVLIIVVAVGVYFLWVKPRQKPAVSPIKITGTESEKEAVVKMKLGESNAYLRTLHVALESWKIDNKTYPDNLYVLTTPIAYLTKMYDDPFQPGYNMNYKKISDTDFLLWGIGPDGKNDDGQIVYDQNNGFTSSGDIVRTPASK